MSSFYQYHRQNELVAWYISKSRYTYDKLFVQWDLYATDCWCVNTTSNEKCSLGDQSFIKLKRALAKENLTYLDFCRLHFFYWHTFHHVYTVFWCRIFFRKDGKSSLKDRHNYSLLLTSGLWRHNAGAREMLGDQSIFVIAPCTGLLILGWRCLFPYLL